MSEVFSRIPGKFVNLKTSIASFKGKQTALLFHHTLLIYLPTSALLEGAGDEYPEVCFYMKGDLEEAIAAGRAALAKWERPPHDTRK